MWKVTSALFIALFTAAGFSNSQSRSTDPVFTDTSPREQGAAGNAMSREARTPRSPDRVESNLPESSREGLMMDCLPSAVNCPVTESSGASGTQGSSESSGSSVTTTDDLPIGSTGDRKGKTVSESQYPTSPGSGSTGSGVTGTPVGPDPGPTFGIGR